MAGLTGHLLIPGPDRIVMPGPDRIVMPGSDRIVMPGSDRIVMPGLTGHLSGIVNPSSRALTRDLQ